MGKFLNEQITIWWSSSNNDKVNKMLLCYYLLHFVDGITFIYYCYFNNVII